MAINKEFLDLPSELRDHIYEFIVADTDVQARTKRPGALIDRWNNITHCSFYRSEIFQSSCAIIATNRQLHSEFYSILHKYVLEQSTLLTVYIVDFDFHPVMDIFRSLSTKQLARFKPHGSSWIELQLDFERFPAMEDTNLKEWLVFATKNQIRAWKYHIVTIHPLQKEWIGHGLEYPNWIRKFYDFAGSANEFMQMMVDEVGSYNGEEVLDYDLADYSRRLSNFRTLLYIFKEKLVRAEEDWWRRGLPYSERQPMQFENVELAI